MTALSEYLCSLNACSEAVAWAEARPDAPLREALASAREDCDRGDWMLWLAARAGVDRKLLVHAALDCAEQALPFVRDEDVLAVLLCLHVAREWCEGRADEADVRAARSAAAAYAYAAAHAVAYAAAAVAVAYAAAAYAYAAAHAVAYAAYVAADAAYARKASLAESARRVRARIPASLIVARLS